MGRVSNTVEAFNSFIERSIEYWYQPEHSRNFFIGAAVGAVAVGGGVEILFDGNVAHLGAEVSALYGGMLAMTAYINHNRIPKSEDTSSGPN